MKKCRKTYIKISK